MLNLKVGQIQEVHSVPESNRHLINSNFNAQNVALECCVGYDHILF